jgi:hypothetical protein
MSKLRPWFMAGVVDLDHGAVMVFPMLFYSEKREESEERMIDYLRQQYPDAEDVFAAHATLDASTWKFHLDVLLDMQKRGEIWPQ